MSGSGFKLIPWPAKGVKIELPVGASVYGFRVVDPGNNGALIHVGGKGEIQGIFPVYGVETPAVTCELLTICEAQYVGQNSKTALDLALTTGAMLMRFGATDIIVVQPTTWQAFTREKLRDLFPKELFRCGDRKIAKAHAMQLASHYLSKDSRFTQAKGEYRQAIADTFCMTCWWMKVRKGV